MLHRGTVRDVVEAHSLQRLYGGKMRQENPREDDFLICLFELVSLVNIQML